MRSMVRWLVVVVVAAHGLIHVLGGVKGLGWAEIAALEGPISPTMGTAWLAVAAAVLAAAVLMAVGARGWWWVAGVAAVASQAVIVTSWADASAGTAANLLLVVAGIYGLRSQGSGSFRARYREHAAASLAAAQDEPNAEARLDGPVVPVTEADLAGLPAQVAGHIRRSGAVGLPRVTSFRARIRGRIRAGADRPWMRFEGEQVNTYGSQPSRVFFITATIFGVPVDVLHVMTGGRAIMRVRLCSLLPLTDAAGPDMDRAETVTLFNDLCILAPAALIDAPVTWQVVDDRHVIGTYTAGDHAVTAELIFDEHGDLVDFVSDDRLAASADGNSFEPQRWSTPLHSYGEFHGRRLAATGEGWWRPSSQEPFAYLELVLDDLVCNEAQPPVGDPLLADLGSAR